MNLVKKIYSNTTIGKIFHTLVNCLQNELLDCETVLDLGCGPDSPIKYCKNINNSIGVEAFKPYLTRSQNSHIHTKYLHDKIENINFPEKSFDAIILIEVIEHLTQEEGQKIIVKAEKWAKKKVIISSPNGFLLQHAVDNNPHQRHLSGWTYEKMQLLGYKCHGLAGLRVFRRETQSNTMGDDLLVSIRWWPKPFWFAIATLSQPLSYYLPRLAFELFCVKNIKA
ncbi:MAG: methyltransferase domain-containing protein [Candidatus Shapirobacteria bacterium]|jgi:SAM-dependent methyltransferase